MGMARAEQPGFDGIARKSLKQEIPQSVSAGVWVIPER